MDTIISIRNKSITVRFHKHAIQIVTDDKLTALLSHEAEEATMELVAEIKKHYAALFHTDFAVSDHSLAVEIWGHVYADEFADWLKNVSDISLIDKIADKMIHHAEIIDIGEQGHDNNRFVWDRLAPLASVIASCLP